MPSSAWWLQMVWCHIGTRPSATIMLTGLWLWNHIFMCHVTQHTYCVTSRKQLVGKPSLSFFSSGSPSPVINLSAVLEGRWCEASIKSALSQQFDCRGPETIHYIMSNIQESGSVIPWLRNIARPQNDQMTEIYETKITSICFCSFIWPIMTSWYGNAFRIPGSLWGEIHRSTMNHHPKGPVI